MMNPEPGRRDTARLVALAEEVAELAAERGQTGLASFARDAARGFEHSVMPADRSRVAIFRHEAARLLRDR